MRFVWRPIVCVVAVSCSASPTADDASDEPEPCDVTKPFGNPQPVAGVNSSADELLGWLTTDELMIYFTAAAPGSFARDIHVASRAKRSEPFGNVMTLPGVNTMYTEQRPVISSDGKTLWAEAGSTIVFATRASTTDDFFPFMPLTEVNGGYADMMPWVSEDGRTLYLTSNRDATIASNAGIYRATRASTTEPWGTPVIVPEIDSEVYDGIPVASQDGLEIFLETVRGGPSRTNMYRASRASTAEPFGAPVPATELDGPTYEAPNWLSADRCRLVYTRASASGDLDLWIATRPE